MSPGAVPLPRVSAAEVDEYLEGVEEPKRSTLDAVRRTILEIVPDAEQVISYGVPAFRVRGKIVDRPLPRALVEKLIAARLQGISSP